jgi:hypothetical protein
LSSASDTVEPDLSRGQLVGDRAGIGKGPGEPVRLGHHQRVAFAAGRQRFPEPGPVARGAGQAVVDVDPGSLDTQAEKAVALGGEVLLVGGAACVSG